MQIALLGSGELELERQYKAAAESNPLQVSASIGYDENLAHQIQAGVDALVVPSRFEPCGLTQLCALRYGAVPVVSRVGGLADTVVDVDEAQIAGGTATGVLFGPVIIENLAGAIRRAGTLFQNKPAWRNVQKGGMPGPNEPSGFVLTTILGIVGAFVATFLGQALGWYGPGQGAGLIGAVVGAIIVLLLYGMVAEIGRAHV